MVAQVVEHLTLDPSDPGSNPSSNGDAFLVVPQNLSKIWLNKEAGEWHSNSKALF